MTDHNNQFSQQIMDNAADGIITIDKHGLIHSFNPSAEKMFGYTEDLLLGKNISCLMPEPFSSQHDDYLQKYQKTGKRNIIGLGSREITSKRRDGSFFPADLAVSEMRQPDGDVLYIGILRDITRRKKIEAELIAKEQRFELIAAGTGDGIWDWDLATDKIYFSPRWKSMLGYNEDDIENSFPALKNLIHPDDLGSTITSWMAGESQSFDIEYRLKNKHSSYTWIRCRGIALRDENDQLVRMAGSHTDISTQKQAFEDMEHMNVTLQINAEFLKQSNKELEQFAYIASHDLKAPLRAIANLSQWIEEDLEEVMEAKTINQMTLLRTRVQRMENLINGFLRYTRIGSVVTDFEVIDVAQMLSDIIDKLEVPAGFKINIPNDMPPAHTHRLLLAQVFTNLLENAIRFHPHPENGHIILTAKQIEQKTLEFSVSDDGLGIAPEYREKVFQIFQTLNPRDKIETTGIGLSIVKKIVRLLGGEISLTSENGNDTTFRFTVVNHFDEIQATSDKIDLSLETTELTER